ncbi:MAG: hypothetical protein DRN53_06430, partial [Thermoprotei archaeon]
MGRKLRDEFIKLLEEDIEFRYIVMSFLGIREILERIDKNTEAIRNLQEQVRILQKQMTEHTEAIRSLQGQVVENTKAIRSLQGQTLELTKELKRLGDRISALGARWGLIAEEVFRESLRKFLQDYFKVTRVERWEHYDEGGFVYGYPSVVEVDLIIKDEVHYLVEVKSSTSKSDISELYRIGILYEKKTGVKPQLTAV